LGSTTLDTGADRLLCEVDAGVATITLNRPEKRNALSNELTPALRQLLLSVDADPAVRCARTAVHREAVQAFIGERKPTFQGK